MNQKHLYPSGPAGCDGLREWPIGRPVLQYAPDSRGVQQYLALAKELIKNA